MREQTAGAGIRTAHLDRDLRLAACVCASPRKRRSWSNYEPLYRIIIIIDRGRNSESDRNGRFGMKSGSRCEDWAAAVGDESGPLQATRPFGLA